ncbi:hypothetical protein SG0102_16120 [Intestinibaculum porci]|uniref:Uncharacterized protein n=1 Tax=Intestinibaculum porci TaxID=2487118 RepID=A0A3G9JQY7_9FIRM|nr:hypothetical protein [Intestinibaculum porci]BBH26678.1 hypothetical protein SG0102_16120 [Intestinibaculum porci]
MLVDVVFLGNHYKISDQLKIRVALTMLNVNLTRELRYKMTNFNFKLHNWEDLEGIIDKYATEFEIYSSYIVSDSNLVNDNPYVNQFREMLYVLKSYYNNAVKEIDQAGSQAIDQAKAQAASTITGPGFGVITNSVSSMIAYDLVSNAAVNKQEKKATEELYKLVTYIKQQAEEQLNELGKSLGSNYFLKSEDLIENIGNYMQTLTESLLVKYGQMNQEELDQYDPETAQRILDQKKR